MAKRHTNSGFIIHRILDARKKFGQKHGMVAYSFPTERMFLNSWLLYHSSYFNRDQPIYFLFTKTDLYINWERGKEGEGSGKWGGEEETNKLWLKHSQVNSTSKINYKYITGSPLQGHSANRTYTKVNNRSRQLWVRSTWIDRRRIVTNFFWRKYKESKRKENWWSK